MRQIYIHVPESKGALVVDCLEAQGVLNIAKIPSKNSFVIMARVPNGDMSTVMRKLEEIGVTVEYGTLNVLNCEISAPMMNERSKGPPSIRAVLTVEQIYANVESAASLSVDWVILLVVAAVIAAAGLAQNSSVVVVASMLLSPLMGPILASSLSVVIRSKELFILGWRNEVFGLVVCYAVGLLMGFLLSVSPFAEQLKLPTEEMTSRSNVAAIAWGAVVASFSGVGVAVSVTKGEVSSLVGVAISASLLPPAVNSGMLLVFALMSDQSKEKERLIMSGYSLLLTILNIVLVNLLAMALFYIKQLKPITQVEGSRWTQFSIAANKSNLHHDDDGTNDDSASMNDRDRHNSVVNIADNKDIPSAFRSSNTVRLQRRKTENMKTIDAPIVDGRFCVALQSRTLTPPLLPQIEKRSSLRTVESELSIELDQLCSEDNFAENETTEY